MTKRTICLAQRIVVMVLWFSLSQSFHYSQTLNTETSPPVVRLRLSFELKKPRQVTFSPVSKLLAVQREDGSVQIVDTTTGREQSVLPLADKEWYSMQWTRDGLRLLVLDKKSAGLWDARAGTRLSPPIKIQRNNYLTVFEQLKLGPDEKLLLNVKQAEGFKSFSDLAKATAQVWSVESAELKYEIKIDGRSARAEWSPNGKRILTISEKDQPKLWHVETGRLFATLEPPQRPLFGDSSEAEFSPDGRFVIQTHEQGIYIWDSTSGALNLRIPYREDRTASYLKGFTPDGKLFATVQNKRGWSSLTSIELRDCETGELRSTLTAEKWSDWPHNLLWSSDGRTVVAASGRKYKARIWDVRTGRVKGTFPMVLRYSRFPLNFGFKDRDELTIHPTLPVISAASNKLVRLWNTETGQLLQTLDSAGWLAEWTADGKLFLTSTKDLKTMYVWDVVDQRRSHALDEELS